MKTGKARLEDRFSIRLAQASNRMFTRIYHHMTVLSPPRLPRNGPAILVCNHVSGLDPLLVQSACGRMIVWMMASEYFDIKGLTWFFKAVRAIPVNRSGRDLVATRAALRTLSDGNVLGVFPEGRIETDQNLLPFQTGVALMAIKTGVPVFPAYLDGTQRGKEMLQAIFQPNDVCITYGKPMTFNNLDTSKETLEAQTARIQGEVFALRAGLKRYRIRSC